MPRRKKRCGGFGVEETPLPAYNLLEGPELRMIVDQFLQGKPIPRIALERKRSRTAIAHILYSKIPNDFTDQGKRESYVDKIRWIPSVLDLNRTLTYQDRFYLDKMLRKRGDLTPARMAIVMNLPEDRVLKALEEL